MRKKGIVVLTLLLVASFMAAIGTGAINVFSATRASSMKVVSDADALISLKGDNKYAVAKGNGELKLDFTETNENFQGQGFNPKADFEFNDLFTITNQSADDVYVWLEANGWSSHQNAGLKYVVDETSEGAQVFKGVDTYKTKTLLTTTGWNFKGGKGSLAYVKLEPGAYFTVSMTVNTKLANGYGSKGYNWGHDVIVKANIEAPVR
jgi:hypothetical protein